MEDCMFVGVKYTQQTRDDIFKIAQRLNIANLFNPDKYHSTITFSRKAFDASSILASTMPRPINDSNLSLLLLPNRNLRGRGVDGALAAVLRFDSSFLRSMHKSCMDLGSTYDFPEYIPHVTVSYDCGLLDLNGLTINANVDLEPECLYTQELKI